MSAAIFLVISAGILLGSSVSKEYQCYQQISGGTARRNFSCQTIQPGNASNQTTTPPYSQTTPSSYPGCPQTLTCTESSFTSVGTITGSPTTTATTTAAATTITTTSDTTLTPTKSTTLTTAPTTTTSNATSATVTLSSLDSSTTFSTTTPTTTSNFRSTTWSTTPATQSQEQRAVIDPKNQVASVKSCFTFDSLNASLGTEDIWCHETLEDHCITNPCRNDATCTSEPYRYRCVCAPGFTDPECMTQINLCENYPCDPFGTCEDFLNDYNCTCKAGFKFINRTYCEDIDECQFINTTATTSSTSTAPTSTSTEPTSTSTEPTIYKPCSNGSHCNNYPGSYECLCQKGKLGKYCEMDDKNELQTVTNIYPTFGLLAGGGLLNITGINLNLYPHLGAFFKPENDSLKELYGFGEGNISDIIRIRIPRAPSTGYIGQKMSITIKYSNDKNLSVPQKYVYTGNPNITSISPSVIPIRVGVMLKIKGHNLNSVVAPVLKTKVIMKDEITASDHSVACRVINETDMVCQLPLIPEVLTNITSASRSKRNAVPDDAKFSPTNSKSFNRELNNWTDWLEDKSSDLSENWNSIRFRRDVGIDNTTKNSSQIPYKIYMGLYFDNFPKYTNLTRSYPRYQPSLILNKPLFKVPYFPQNFDPRIGESFKIEGKQMNYGVSLEDYTVRVGTETCQPSHLEETLLECLPPKLRPEPGPLAVIFDCGENLPVMVLVGSLEPQFYACMKYIGSDKRVPLIIGLSVGLTGFLVLVIILAWLVCCLIRKKGRLQTEAVADESTTWNNELRPSYRRMVASADLGPEVRDFAGGYSNAINDRRGTREQNPSDIVSVSQRNRGQAKDYFFYGENNPDVALVKKQTYGEFLKAKDRISYTRPNRQFDDVEGNNLENKGYKQVYHNMSFNKLDN